MSEFDFHINHQQTVAVKCAFIGFTARWIFREVGFDKTLWNWYVMIKLDHIKSQLYTICGHR